MKKHLFLFVFLLAAACQRVPTAEWTEGAKQDDGRAMHTLVLHHMTEGSRVWFQELYDGKTMVEGPEMHHYQGTSWYIDIPSAGTVTLKYFGRPLPRHSWAPEGFVLQQKGKPDTPMEVTYHFLEQLSEKACEKSLASQHEVQFSDIIPRVKSAAAPMEETREHPAGWYRITIDHDGTPAVESDDEEGAFYAQVTLDKIPRPLQPMTIEDWPDFPYRGFMLDVVRDFRSVDEVLQIIDLMASWKLNTLHFHLADDESWCLEIKDLPELTEYGAHHALPDWDLKETMALKPTVNGKIGNVTYYTTEEYQRILRYAWERRIVVIPEFDTPGHSRASIKAMQAYERRTGDNSYRLQDPADTSHYWSAQDFTDNVLSVDLPSVYKFYGVVFDEIIRLHREAGVPLKAIHIGGDEVPEGAWSGHDRHEMKEMFINGMIDLAEARDIKLAGWEDIAKGLEPETEARLKRSLYFVNVWNTDGIEGFPVVLSPAAYTYLDLAYNDSPDEIGLSWAGYVDEQKTFALQPKNYKGNVIGVQAQLWSSQLRNFDDATYQMLPKALGVAERAWNAYPNWSTEADFKTDFERFQEIICSREVLFWKQKNLNYRIQ
ncbi:MAG: family 20 glycosylhydrolase [Bacteroidales bacterium]|nr:family 20 glycosylhydrolase [Bacteroidales bacterium]